jgi:hypothetical protein
MNRRIKNRAGTSFRLVITGLQIAIAIATVATSAGWVSRPSNPVRGSCRDATERANRSLKTSAYSSLTKNPAGRILLRVRASRPELASFDTPKGTPDLRALLTWAASAPDTSAIALASCSRATAELARELDVQLPSDGLPLLASLLAWMEQRSPKSTEVTHLESNRNLMFEIHRVTRERFIPAWLAEHDSQPSAAEVMKWARTRPASDRSYDELWSALLRLELDPSA